MKRNALLLAALLLLYGSSRAVFAADSEICLYLNERGQTVQVNSRADVPERFKSSVKCLAARTGGYLAAPEKVELKGTTRRDSIATSIGRFELRWPRSAEELFGRTPVRALNDAAATVSRALRQAGFPSEVSNLKLDWQVVFMDEKLPEKQIPAWLVGSCHPAWMTAPASIYVVAQRVAAGCGGGRNVVTRESDAQLATVLIHEIGHAIEHQLLSRRDTNDRMRAEGFAAWFEQYAARFSSVVPAEALGRMHGTLALQAIKASPSSFDFSGSATDYSRASMYFSALVDKRGLRAIDELYRLMRDKGLPFMQAMSQVSGWRGEDLSQAVERRAAELAGGH